MRILSGIQPTGFLHIGNYLGAIKQWIKFQEKNEAFFFIADLHSLTIPYNPVDLQKRIQETATEYLAAGLDPKKSVLFVQSHIPEHTELCWLLNTVCPVGDLQRMTQYKEKSQQFKKDINAGLLNYPILQAADILIYKANQVPVGKDQVQHIELTRTIAKRFNQKFSKVFVLPEPYLSHAGAKIMALNNPEKKMSKSLGPASYVSLFEEPTTIKKKVMSAVTDAGREIKYDPSKKPGISNLLTIYSLFSEKTINSLEKEFKQKGYSDLKKELAQLLIEKLEPFRTKREELLSNSPRPEKVLNQGARKAQKIAQSTLKEAKKAMGLVT